MKKKSQVVQSIPEVYPDAEVDVGITDDGEVKKTDKSHKEKVFGMGVGLGLELDSPILPEYYNRLSQVDMSKTLSKSRVYQMIERFTPYLVQNLLYLSQHPNASVRDRAHASKILLDKILPNLEASQVQLNSDNLQSLVIVKSNTKDKD
jgi:hypothetical protein